MPTSISRCRFPIPDYPLLDFPISAFPTPGLWLLVNGVLNGGHFAFLVASLPSCDISGFSSLKRYGYVNTFPVDMGQPRKGISQSSGKDSICDNKPFVFISVPCCVSGGCSLRYIRVPFHSENCQLISSFAVDLLRSRTRIFEGKGIFPCFPVPRSETA